MRRAANVYVDDFLRWRTFGFKDDGGYDNQEAEYLDAIDVCKLAWESVQREVEEAERQRAGSGNKRRRL